MAKAQKNKKRNKTIEQSRNAIALAALARKSAGSMNDTRLKRKRTRRAQKQNAIESNI